MSVVTNHVKEEEPFLDDENDKARIETPDHVLQTLGGCGRFQIFICFMIQMMKIVVCWGMAGNTFFAYSPNWKCSSFDGTASSLNISFQGSTTMTSLLGDISPEAPDDLNKQCKTPTGEDCVQITFEDGINTLVSEFDLVCGLSWVPATATSIQMAGMCAGSIIIGPIADAIGRKKPFVCSMFMLAVFHTICYFAPSWIVYAVSRLFIGIASAIFLSIYCTLQSEFTLSKWRAFAIGFPSWALESSCFALIAYLVPDWKIISLVMAVMGLAFGLTALFLPESFRWLISVNKFKDARQVVNRIARSNRREEPDFEPLKRTICSIVEQERSKFSILTLLKTRPLLKVTLPLGVTWFSMGLVAYGINFGVTKLSGNIFMNLFIFGMASLPSKLLSIYLQNRFGRKVAAIIAFSWTGVAGLLVAIIQYIETPHKGTIINFAALTAMTGVDGTWGPMQTISLEVYPTIVRTGIWGSQSGYNTQRDRNFHDSDFLNETNTGFGFLSTLGRLGAVVGPQLVYLGDYIPGILYVMVAVCAFLSVLSILCLPETGGLVLVDKLSTDDFTDNRMKE